jgi:hypothetical protein
MTERMSSTQARDSLRSSLRARFEPIAVILSPPRCGSTVLGWSLWHHPVFRGYLHEPYDRVYYDGELPSSRAVLDSVLERARTPGSGRGLVIKEMTFQVADRAPELVEAATMPVIFLIRDPRLSVSSRMCCREDGGEVASFSEREAGWQDLVATREDLRRVGRDYVVLDISDVRRDPAAVLAVLCERLGLVPDSRMLSWQPSSGLRLGRLDGRQDDWYRRVLASTGFQRPNETVPDQEYFRARRMLDVVMACLPLYRQARADPRFIGPAYPAPGRTGNAEAEAW